MHMCSRAILQNATRGAPQPGFDPESAAGIRGTLDFNLTNALHVIKRLAAYAMPSSLRHSEWLGRLRSAVQAKRPRKSAEAAAERRMLITGPRTLRQGDP